MTLTQLTYFQTVAKYRHMTRAAEALKVAQPAVSKTIKDLETELKTPLFSRTGNTIYLNQCGQILLKYTEQIFDCFNNIHTEIQAAKENLLKSVTFFSQVTTKFLPHILVSFRNSYPDANVTLVLDENKADVKLLCTTLPREDSHSVTLMKERLLLAVQSGHAIARRASVNLDMLKDMDFIRLSGHKSSPCQLKQYCELSGFTPNIVLESDNISIVREMVESGFGVALIPEQFHRQMEFGNIKLLNIDNPECVRYYVLSWKEEKHMEQAMSVFIEHLKHYFTNIPFNLLSNNRDIV